MSFFNRLFGGGKKPEPVKALIEDHLDYLKSLRKPALALRPTKADTFNRIGGLPDLPPDLRWPVLNGKPFMFLCQLDLSTIPRDPDFPQFHQSGLVYFFHGLEFERDGGSPLDKDHWKVLYSNSGVDDCRRADAPDGLDEFGLFGVKQVEFVPILTYPDIEDKRVKALNLSSESRDKYYELNMSVYEPYRRHQLFGHHQAIQHVDMDWTCQLASNDLHAASEFGQKEAGARGLEEGRKDWTLFLQVDSDDEIDMFLGDNGMFYFWIRKQDLEAGRFDKFWALFECY